MKPFHNLLRKIKDEKGIVSIYVALLLMVFLGMAAYAIDVGYHRTVRNQLQNAADAGALAGARRLGENYFIKDQPPTGVIEKAKTIAEANYAAALKLTDDNVVSADPLSPAYGTWDADLKTFTANTQPYNAVSVTTKTTFAGFFSPVLDKPTLETEATACAAISGICQDAPGIPLGIDKKWFTNDLANRGCTTIAVNKTQASCAGWTSLTDKFDHKITESLMDNMVTNPTDTLPLIEAGSEFDFGGGTITGVIDSLVDLYEAKKDASGKWTTSVLVYDTKSTSTNCDNPHAKYEIVGFATITITGATTEGNSKGITGVVDCEVGTPARGGCFYAGTYGTIPGLVK